MKKIILGFLMLFCGLHVWSQSGYEPCYDPNWDWSIPQNWKVYFSNSNSPNGEVLYPFADATLTRDLDVILKNSDLSRNEGWVVLKKNLGCSERRVVKPYVIFYNYYRGIIRMLGYHTYESSTRGLMTVGWGLGERTSALTHSNVYSRANDQYPAYNNDMVMMQIDNYASGQWWVCDFQVAFDHKTKATQSSTLAFSFYGVTTSDIKLVGEVDLVSQTIEVKGTKSSKDAGTANNLKQWAVDGQKAVQKLNYNEWDDYMKKAKTKADSLAAWAAGQWAENLSFRWLQEAAEKTSDALSNKSLVKFISTGAKALGAVNAIFGFAGDFIDLFVGKPSKSSTPSIVQLAPQQITGTIVHSGTIKTTAQHGNYILDLPGTTSIFPYYTCPLGVLNLEKVPNVNMRKWETPEIWLYDLSKETIYRKVTGMGSNKDTSGYLCKPATGHSSTPDPYYNISEEIYFVNTRLGFRTKHEKEKWKSVQLKEDLKIAVNSAANLELISAKVALQGKVKTKSDGKGSYDLMEKFQTLPDDISKYKIYKKDTSALSHGLNGLCREYRNGALEYPPLIQTNELADGQFLTLQEYKNLDRWKNYTLEKIMNKEYFLIGDEGNSIYKFRTSFVDIENAKGLSFTVREETELSIKIMAVFKEVNNDDAPLMIYTNEYLLDEGSATIESQGTPYPFIKNQLNEIELYEGNDDVSILRNTLVVYPITSKQIRTDSSVAIRAINIPIDFTAEHSIVFNPGTTIEASDMLTFKGSFSTRIREPANVVSPNYTQLNQIVKYYKDGVAYNNPVPCNCKPSQSQIQFAAAYNNELRIQNAVLDENCHIYPNPFSDVFNIDYVAKEKTCTVAIFDMNGRLVYQENMFGNSQQVNLSGFANGVYLVRISDGQNVINRKIIKQ